MLHTLMSWELRNNTYVLDSFKMSNKQK